MIDFLCNMTEKEAAEWLSAYAAMRRQAAHVKVAEEQQDTSGGSTGPSPLRWGLYGAGIGGALRGLLSWAEGGSSGKMLRDMLLGSLIGGGGGAGTALLLSGLSNASRALNERADNSKGESSSSYSDSTWRIPAGAALVAGGAAFPGENKWTARLRNLSGEKAKITPSGRVARSVAAMLATYIFGRAAMTAANSIFGSR